MTEYYRSTSVKCLEKLCVYSVSFYEDQLVRYKINPVSESAYERLCSDLFEETIDAFVESLIWIPKEDYALIRHMNHRLNQLEEKLIQIYLTSLDDFASSKSLQPCSSTIVLDVGSSCTRIGFAGKTKPQFVLSSDNHMLEEIIDEYPVGRDGVNNWNGLQLLYHECFTKKMKVNPEEHTVLLVESSSVSNVERETSAEILFESFHTEAIYHGTSSVLALLASLGVRPPHWTSLTGLVLESGDGRTNLCPIMHGFLLKNKLRTFPIAGSDITEYLRREVSECRQFANSCEMLKMNRSFKHNHCRLSYPDQDDCFPAHAVNYYMAPELFWNPQLKSSEYTHSITDVVDQTIQSCPIEIRRHLYGGVILTGGSTMIKGFDGRLLSDLSHLANRRPNGLKNESEFIDVQLTTHKKQSYSAWIGGSLIASMEAFKKDCTTRNAYEEEGRNIFRNSPCVLVDS